MGKSIVKLSFLGLVLMAWFASPALASRCLITARYVVTSSDVTYVERGARLQMAIDIPLQNVHLRSFKGYLSKDRSFVNCYQPYGRDRHRVYYRGRILIGIDPMTFVSNRFGHNDKRFFVVDGNILGPKLAVRTLGDMYFRVGNNYFYRGRKLGDTIRVVIKTGYAIGDRNFYVHGKATRLAPKNFHERATVLCKLNDAYCSYAQSKIH
ncbi:MAG: hypothetical protein ACI89J_000258 [Hyphomicrobiaceae bacterium]